MARNIDETKISRIKDLTLKMVVQKGYSGATISEIANGAGVAEGYLYRHYKGKNELVNDLLYQGLRMITDKIEALLEKQNSANDILENCIKNIFELAMTKPEWIKFLFVLMHDYNFSIQESQHEQIKNLCLIIKERGEKSGEFHKKITVEEIYLMAVVYPMEFINLRFKCFFNESEIGKKEIKNAIQVCLKSLK